MYEDDEEELDQVIYIPKAESVPNNGSITMEPTKNDQMADIIAQHYNKRKDLGIEYRKESPIFHLKNFNNWVKSLLIGKYCKKGTTVLDLGGGKGGDLLKFVKGNISRLVVADIAYASIKDGLARYNELKECPFTARFICADCFKVGFLDGLPKDIEFDLVSCQFALHYAFETETKANGVLYNITSRLKPGSMFIGTIPNANWIVKKLRSSPGLTFGNEIYSIRFDQKEHFSEFGWKYYFTLEDAVDCPEFLVNINTLRRLALKYDLELKMAMNFHQFYEQNKLNIDNIRLLHRMKVFSYDLRNPNGGMGLSPEEWEVAGMYLVFAFQKKGEYTWVQPATQVQRRTQLTEEDIITIS